MCGIVGLLNFKDTRENVNKNTLAMMDLIKHRGPNDSGLYRDSFFPFSMGMTRLSIMDIENGSQPVASNDNRYQFIFNGEIVNSLDLKKYLVQKYKINFNSKTSDTEVAFNLLVTEGIESINKLNGMFALCLYDSKKKIISVARDRSGIKPLYYVLKDNFFSFSSEIKPLIFNQEVSKNINFQSLYHYTSLMYVPGPNTIFDEIKKIEPGTILKFQIENNHVEFRKFHAISFGSWQKRKQSDLNNEIYSIFNDSINRWSQSDVSISCSLSGGIDSTSIAYCMNQNGNNFINYTLGFSNSDFKSIDESETAIITSQNLNKHFEKVSYDNETLFEDINDCVKSLEQPYAGGLPSWPLYKKIKEKNKVVMVGTGGDELFGNYGKWKRLFLVSKFLPINKNLFKKYYFNLFYYCKDEDKKELFNFNLNKFQPTSDYLFRIYNDSEFKNPIDQIANLDFKTQLTDEFLFMTDKFSMAHSVEARPVYLDNELIEYLSNTHYSQRTNIFDIKRLQKDALKKYIPTEIMNKNKQGFVLPIDKWSKENHLDYLLSFFDKKKLKKQGIFNENLIESLINPLLYSNARFEKIWGLFMFQMWYSNFIDSL